MKLAKLLEKDGYTVKIAGFDVSPSRMINVGTSGSGVGIAPESGHGC